MKEIVGDEGVTASSLAGEEFLSTPLLEELSSEREIY
jgi:hypothetical protein